MTKTLITRKELMTELLSVKDLANRLKRSTRYVWYMRSSGFTMIAGRATLESALQWLQKQPKPCAKKSQCVKLH